MAKTQTASELVQEAQGSSAEELVGEVSNPKKYKQQVKNKILVQNIKDKYNKFAKGTSNVLGSILQRQKAKAIPRAMPTQQISSAQRMLQEMFRGEPTFGTGQNLPIINGELRTGHGLINNGDTTRRTGRMFGLRY